MPVSFTMMAEHMPAGRRARASTLTMAGYHTGAVITSLLALQFTGDWPLWFYVAGLVVAAIQWFRLPESEAFVQAKEATSAQRVPLTELLKPACLRAGIGIWGTSFMGLLLVYGLNTWLPKLMNDAGYPVPTAVAQLLVLNVGGVVGLVIGGFATDQHGIKGTTLAWFGASVLMPTCLIIRMKSNLILSTVVFLTGVFVFSAMVLVYACVTSYYPASVRSTALGSASGIGHPWGTYFFAAVAVLGFLAVLTLPRRPGPVSGRRWVPGGGIPPRSPCPGVSSGCPSARSSGRPGTGRGRPPRSWRHSAGAVRYWCRRRPRRSGCGRGSGGRGSARSRSGWRW
jgi:MFS family permease